VAGSTGEGNLFVSGLKAFTCEIVGGVGVVGMLATRFSTLGVVGVDSTFEAGLWSID
jgi:hypothetical protein